MQPLRPQLQKDNAALCRQTRGGISLVEMLVVISIIGLLAGLLLPGLQAARESARRLQCQNHLKQIGIALFAHTAAHGCLPTGGATSVWLNGGDLDLRPRAINGDWPLNKQQQTWGWAYQILPYLDLQNRWRNPDDTSVRGSLVEYYQCPTRQGGTIEFADMHVGTSHYVGNACSSCTPSMPLEDGRTSRPRPRGLGWGTHESEWDGVFVPSSQKPRSMDRITDGLSSTVFVAEKRRLASSQACNNSTGWVSGYPATDDETTYGHDTLFSGLEGAPTGDELDAGIQCSSRAGGGHQTGGNVLFGDGSVRFIAFGMDPDVWRAQLSITGGEDVDTVAGALLSP